MTHHSETDFDEPDVPPVPAVPSLGPRLPPPAPRVSQPAPTGAPAPAQFVPNAPVAARQMARRRSPVAWILVVLVLVAAGGALYVLKVRPNDSSDADTPRDKASSVETTTSVDAAASGLPDLHFDRPALTSATWAESMSSLSLDESGVEQVTTTDITAAADYTQSIVRFDAVQGKSGNHLTVIVTPDFTYSPGDEFGAPWTRTQRDPGSIGGRMDEPDYLDVYQGRVTERVRAGATNVTSTTEVVNERTVTTFSFDVDLHLLGEAESSEIPPTVVEHPLVGHMDVSIDESGLVRRWSFVLDRASASDLLAAGAESVPLSFGADVSSTNEPVDVALPTDFVDELPDVCSTDKVTLETAVETYLAQYGPAAVPTEGQLVEAQLLRRESDTYDVVNGEVVAVAGGPCDAPG